MATKTIALTIGLVVVAFAQAQSPAGAQLAPVIRFGGIEWQLKDSGDRRVGPGPNWFSAENVTLDADGKLHLRAGQRKGECVSAEIVGAPNLGYGTYRFTISSDLGGLARNLVVGLFVWDDAAAESFHREIDVELGRWSQEDGAEGQFVIQPSTIPTNIFRFPLPRGARGSVYSFTWSPRRVTFRAEQIGSSGPAFLIKERVFERMIPEPGSEQPRINLWCADTKAPLGGTTEIVLDNFSFTPLR